VGSGFRRVREASQAVSAVFTVRLWWRHCDGTRKHNHKAHKHNSIP
jgi:hypothetical protein